MELKKCPFCNNEPELIKIGNEFTRRRCVKIKCTRCHTEQRTGAINQTLEWCEEIAINKWNMRVQEKIIKEKCYEIFKNCYPNLDAFGHIKKQMLNDGKKNVSGS